MPKQISGIVENISKDQTKSGKNIGKTYYKVKIKDFDKLLFVWNYSVIKDVNKGDEVDFGVEENGDFLTAIDAVPVIRPERSEPMSTEDVAREKAIEGPPAAGTLDLKNLTMARESALKSAVEFTKGLSEGPGLEDVIAVALRFFDYIESGK